MSGEIIGFVDGGERKVGDPAKRQAITNPKKTIFSIKRFMGETYDQVQTEVADREDKKNGNMSQQNRIYWNLVTKDNK